MIGLPLGMFEGAVEAVKELAVGARSLDVGLAVISATFQRFVKAFHFIYNYHMMLS